MRELLKKQPKFYLYRTDDKTTIINAYKSLDKYIGELTAEVKAFLEPSPQTTEMQKLIEDELRRMWSESDTQMIMSVVDEVFMPKLEAFFADHVSREKLGKLIEDFPTLDFGDFNIPNTADFIEFVIRTREWRKRLELLTEKGDSKK